MKGLSALQASLSALPAKAARAAQAALRQSAASAEAYARGRAPVRTGALRSSIAVRLDNNKAVLSARVPYAGIAEGRTPYLAPAVRQADFPRCAKKTFKEALK